MLVWLGFSGAFSFAGRAMGYVRLSDGERAKVGRLDYTTMCIPSPSLLSLTRSLPRQSSALIQLRRDQGHTTAMTFPKIKLRDTCSLSY